MKTIKKVYTEEETFKFKKARNEAGKQASVSSVAGYIWDGIKGTFRGSIRAQFTGPRRNNFQ